MGRCTMSADDSGMFPDATIWVMSKLHVDELGQMDGLGEDRGEDRWSKVAIGRVGGPQSGQMGGRGQALPP